MYMLFYAGLTHNFHGKKGGGGWSILLFVLLTIGANFRQCFSSNNVYMM